jgi:hypothetical protein
MINDIRVKVDFLVIFICSCLLVPSVHLPELSKTVASTTVNSALSVRSSEHLRQPSAFVILPAGNSTAIAGIVLKADDKGATYICFPSRYLNFGKLWFEIQNEKISDLLNSINRVDIVPQFFSLLGLNENE